jgi:hypothetical protein
MGSAFELGGEGSFWGISHFPREGFFIGLFSELLSSMLLGVIDLDKTPSSLMLGAAGT